MAWPTATIATIEVNPASSRLHLPIRQAGAENYNPTQFGTPRAIVPLTTTQLRDFEQQRNISIDPDSGAHIFRIFADNGKIRFHNNQVEMASTTLQQYAIHPDDPLSARAEYEWEWEYSRNPNWRVRTFTRTDMRCDKKYFYVKTESVAWEHEQEVFRKEQERKYKRDYF